MSLWDLALQNKDLLRFSTLFTAQNVRDLLADEEGIRAAVEWCRGTGVTKVYIESFRNGYTAPRDLLERARDRFKEEGFDVAGCVTTTELGKRSTGWKIIACYTDEPTLRKLQEVFEYAASIFDLIMIDDFLFTDCECESCQKAKGDRSWAEFRCELMAEVCRRRIIEPAKSVNPNAKLIIKYPQWYDDFHNRGYDVVRETEIFDYIWVGTETRDPDNERWGRKMQYEAYYIMRWLGEIGGEKTGGGWFDPYGTSPPTYVEQARQTILADAKEVLLFCYGSLLRDTGPADVERLRGEMPRLFELAKLVRGEPTYGVSAPKPPNSDPGSEPYVFDFVGMLGLPLVPTSRIDPNSPAIFLSYHALKDPQLKEKVDEASKSGKPLLITDGLADRIGAPEGGAVLPVRGDPRSLLSLSRDELRRIREGMLSPWELSFDAPTRVSLYLIGDRVIVENFNDEPATVKLAGGRAIGLGPGLALPSDEGFKLKPIEGGLEIVMPPRSLIALEG